MRVERAGQEVDWTDVSLLGIGVCQLWLTLWPWSHSVSATLSCLSPHSPEPGGPQKPYFTVKLIGGEMRNQDFLAIYSDLLTLSGVFRLLDFKIYLLNSWVRLWELQGWAVAEILGRVLYFPWRPSGWRCMDFG